MSQPNTRRTTHSCGHAEVVTIPKPTFWRKFKTSFTGKPLRDVNSPGLCGKCFLIQDANDREQALNRLAKSQRRAAPAARGTAETVHAIALGQDPDAIEALYTVQRQSATAAPTISPKKVQEASPFQQVTSQNATMDLIRASNFWTEIHTNHHLDFPVYGRPIQSGPNNCRECLKVQLSFNPIIRRKNSFNDVQRTGTRSTTNSVDLFFRSGSRNSSDEEAIESARRPQDDWDRDHSPEGASRAPAPSIFDSPTHSEIPESSVSQQSVTRRGHRRQEPASLSVEQPQGEVEEERFHLVARPPQHLLDRLASRESRSSNPQTTPAERPLGPGTISKESPSQEVQESRPTPGLKVPTEFTRQDTPQDEEPAARQTRCQLRFPNLEHPPSPPPRGEGPEISVMLAHPQAREDEESSVQQTNHLQVPQRDQSSGPPPRALGTPEISIAFAHPETQKEEEAIIQQTNLQVPVLDQPSTPTRGMSVQICRPLPSRDVPIISLPKGTGAHLWRPGQQIQRRVAFASTADFPPSIISRGASLGEERRVPAAGSESILAYPEVRIQEAPERPAFDLIFPHSLAGQVARSNFIQYLSLPSDLTIAEVQKSGSAKLAYWLEEDHIANPSHRRGVRLFPRLEDQLARRNFLATWRSINWEYASFQPHQPSEQDIAVNVPLPQADWEEFEFLSLTDMDIIIHIQPSEEGIYDADEEEREVRRAPPQNQVHRFLRRITTPIEPSENELEHRVSRPSSLRTEVVVEEVEEDDIEEEEEEEEKEVSGWWDSESEDEEEAPPETQTETTITHIEPPQDQLENRVFEPSPLRRESVIREEEIVVDNETVDWNFVLNSFLAYPTQPEEEDENTVREEAKVGRKLC